MKQDPEYTNKEIDAWLSIFDSEIVIDIYESRMLPELEDRDFSEFLEEYQRLHLKKYGNYLKLIEL